MKTFLEQFDISGVKWHGNSGYVSLGKKTVAKIILGLTIKGKTYSDKPYLIYNGLEISIIKKGGGLATDATTFNFYDFLRCNFDGEETFPVAFEASDGTVDWVYSRKLPSIRWINSDNEIVGLDAIAEAIDEYIEMFEKDT